MDEFRTFAAFRADIVAMPAALQRLLEAELDAARELVA